MVFLYIQGCSKFKDLNIHDGNDLCKNLDLDEVSINFGCGNEIFNCSQDPTRYPFEDGGMDCLLMEKNLSVTESNGPTEGVIEVHPLLNYCTSLCSIP